MEQIRSLDYKISNFLRIAENPGIFRAIAASFAHSGDSWICLAVTFLIWYFGDPAWKYRMLFITIAFMTTALVVMIIKFIVRRKRPEGEWGGMYRKTDPYSFPSGHAARGLLIGVVALGLGPPVFGITLMIWGPIVGLARIAMGVHFFSDVLAGWIVGGILGIVGLNGRRSSLGGSEEAANIKVLGPDFASGNDLARRDLDKRGERTAILLAPQGEAQAFVAAD